MNGLGNLLAVLLGGASGYLDRRDENRRTREERKRYADQQQQQSALFNFHKQQADEARQDRQRTQELGIVNNVASQYPNQAPFSDLRSGVTRPQERVSIQTPVPSPMGLNLPPAEINPTRLALAQSQAGPTRYDQDFQRKQQLDSAKAAAAARLHKLDADMRSTDKWEQMAASEEARFIASHVDQAGTPEEIQAILEHGHYLRGLYDRHQMPSSAGAENTTPQTQAEPAPSPMPSSPMAALAAPTVPPMAPSAIPGPQGRFGNLSPGDPTLGNPFAGMQQSPTKPLAAGLGLPVLPMSPNRAQAGKIQAETGDIPKRAAERKRANDLRERGVEIDALNADTRALAQADTADWRKLMGKINQMRANTDRHFKHGILGMTDRKTLVDEYLAGVTGVARGFEAELNAYKAKQPPAAWSDSAGADILDNIKSVNTQLKDAQDKLLSGKLDKKGQQRIYAGIKEQEGHLRDLKTAYDKSRSPLHLRVGIPPAAPSIPAFSPKTGLPPAGGILGPAQQSKSNRQGAATMPGKSPKQAYIDQGIANGYDAATVRKKADERFGK